jgi:hypothetical protein
MASSTQNLETEVWPVLFIWLVEYFKNYIFWATIIDMRFCFAAWSTAGGTCDRDIT